MLVLLVGSLIIPISRVGISVGSLFSPPHFDLAPHPPLFPFFLASFLGLGFFFSPLSSFNVFSPPKGDVLGGGGVSPLLHPQRRVCPPQNPTE
ncbi:hypothetical protein FKM82_024934 [Ascaphus truei]